MHKAQGKNSHLLPVEQMDQISAGWLITKFFKLFVYFSVYGRGECALAQGRG